MNSMLFSDVDLNSEDAWGAFDLAHGIDHEFVYQSMLRNGLTPFYVPLFGFSRKGEGDYLLSHDQVHQSAGRQLNIMDVPDLSTVDFSDPQALSDWLNLHTLVHLAENRALGLQ